ncbi:glycosyltransferase [Chitinophaga sp. 22536]|uniref:glycosyltransferase n=1 Tax=unclassified Chitinophaga TaxID=2619133 RepID=UPI003F8276F8
MDNKIIQSLWVGSSRLSTMELLCINSFVKNGHDFHLYVYDEIENIPSGTVLMDASQIVPSEVVFQDGGTWAHFADYFRYCLLYKKGGWWVDMDSICLKYFDVPEEYCFSSEYDRFGNIILNCGNIKAPAHAEFLKECIDYINARGFDNLYWGEISLKLMKKVLDTYESEEYMRSPEVFCPLDTMEVHRLIDGRPYSIPEESLAIHLWNELWRRNGFNKDWSYAPGSLYEKLKRQYLVQ